MLVITRTQNESVVIGDTIVVTVVDIRGDKVRLGIDAPREVPIHRQEIFEALRRESAPASDELLPEPPTPFTKTRVNLDVHQVEFLEELASQLAPAYRLWPPGSSEILGTLIDAVIAMQLDLSKVHNLQELKDAVVRGDKDS